MVWRHALSITGRIIEVQINDGLELKVLSPPAAMSHVNREAREEVLRTPPFYLTNYLLEESSRSPPIPINANYAIDVLYLSSTKTQELSDDVMPPAFDMLGKLSEYMDLHQMCTVENIALPLKHVSPGIQDATKIFMDFRSLLAALMPFIGLKHVFLVVNAGEVKGDKIFLTKAPVELSPPQHYEMLSKKFREAWDDLMDDQELEIELKLGVEAPRNTVDMEKLLEEEGPNNPYPWISVRD